GRTLEDDLPTGKRATDPGKRERRCVCSIWARQVPSLHLLLGLDLDLPLGIVVILQLGKLSSKLFIPRVDVDRPLLEPLSEIPVNLRAEVEEMFLIIGLH